MPAITKMDGSMWILHGYLRETDPGRLKGFFLDLLEKSGFIVLGTIDHDFVPEGYTRLELLGESHLGIHTFPDVEENPNTYFELASCVEKKYRQFRNRISRLSKNLISISFEGEIRPPKFPPSRRKKRRQRIRSRDDIVLTATRRGE